MLRVTNCFRSTPVVALWIGTSLLAAACSSDSGDDGAGAPTAGRPSAGAPAFSGGTGGAPGSGGAPIAGAKSGVAGAAGSLGGAISAGTSGSSGAGGTSASGGSGASGGPAVGGATGGTGTGGSTAGASTGGSSASGGAAGKGSSGAAGMGTGGSMPTAGTTGVAGSAAGSGGAPIGSNCTPNPSGGLVATGDVVLDQKTCLYWMKESVGGMGLAAAKTYCEGLTRGGFDDWRVPIASEVASIVTKCGTYPPIDTNVFTISGDGIWTTTESGSVAGPDAKVCGVGQNTGQYYDFGPVGAQNTRCVRGTGTFPMVKGCKDSQGCTNW